jgi:hypothetical protein
MSVLFVYVDEDDAMGDASTSCDYNLSHEQRVSRTTHPVFFCMHDMLCFIELLGIPA